MVMLRVQGIHLWVELEGLGRELWLMVGIGLLEFRVRQRVCIWFRNRVRVSIVFRVRDRLVVGYMIGAIPIFHIYSLLPRLIPNQYANYWHCTNSVIFLLKVL